MAVDERRFEAAAGNSARKKGEQKNERFHSARGLAELRKVASGSRYAGPLAERQKSGDLR